MQSHPATQKAVYTLIACKKFQFEIPSCIHVGYSTKHKIIDNFLKDGIFASLTPFRPIKSAIGPLVIAPIIAPKVNKEPKREYCITYTHEAVRFSV